MNFFTRFQLRLAVGFILLLFATSTILAVNTSSTRTINVATAGKLSTLLPEADRQYVVSLTLTGKLNGTDFNILRTMATDLNLQTLDLSGANIVSGGDSYYTHYGTDYYTKNNEFGFSLFGHCSKIQKIVLPNSLVTIGQCAFWYCTNLKTLVIGPNVTTINPGVWGGCKQLTDVQLKNNSNFHLDNGILYNKGYTIIIAALQSVDYGDLTIRSGVKEIQYNAFSFCSKLTSIVFPTSLTTIGDTAFQYTDISSISFTSSITSIGSFAFSGCKSLKKVDMTPLKITTLSYGLFMTSNIEIVYLPKSLKELKQAVFSMTPLKHIFAYTATPATMYDFTSSSASFENVNTNTCVVHVPTGKVSAYKAAAGWKEFQYITDSQEIESVKEAYAVYTDNGTLTFYYDNQKDSRDGVKYSLNMGTNYPGWYTEHRKDIKKGVFNSSFASARPTSTYYWFGTDSQSTSNLSEISGIENLNTSEVTNMFGMFYLCNGLSKIDVSHFNTSKVTNMSMMFYGCSSLKNLDVSSFDTKNVTNMRGMFKDCSNLMSLNLSNFNTYKVTNMCSMFEGCKGLMSLDVSSFDTRNVQDMGFMFSVCGSLKNLDVSHFNTDNVTAMDCMFQSCSSLTSLNVSHFNTSKVKNMMSMFWICNNLTSLDVSSFDTSSVTDMSSMFYYCTKLETLDLSSFDTHNVTQMSSKYGYGMFQYCYNLRTIYVGEGWNTENVSNSTNLFNSCRSLVGGAGTKYDANHVDVAYAHIDGGKSNPGYLTDKNAPQEPEKVCDSDDLLNALLALEGNGTGTEDNHATLTPCDSGLAVDNDVDIDDDLYIDLVGKKPDGSKSDMVFSGSSINVMTGSMVRMSQFVLKSEGNGGGISNSGNLTISDCELQDGDYTVENLSGSTMTLNDNTIAGSGIIVNSGNLYVDGSCTVNGLKNNAGGCIFLTSTPMTYIRIILDEVTVESLGVPVIAGADGYILTETDANALTIDVPDGYEWYYDADMQAVCIRTSTAIEDVRNNKTRVAEGYDTSGRKVSNKYRGLRILRMNDGSVKKNVKKN